VADAEARVIPLSRTTSGLDVLPEHNDPSVKRAE
jgi:hypothetical protein